MSLGPPRGVLTAAQSAALDAALPDVEPPPRRRRRGRSRPSRSEFSRPLRLAILARDGMRCQLCGVTLTLEPNRANSGVAGHVIAAWQGGLPTAENGRAECWTCSARGGAAERVASGQRPWRQSRRPRTTQAPNVW